MEVIKNNDKNKNKNKNKNKKDICKLYGEKFKVNVFIKNNDVSINSLDFVICEQTTLYNLLKITYEIVYPKKDYTKSHPVEILWNTTTQQGFDKIWSPMFKMTMSFEYLKKYYDNLYTKNNYVFLKI